MIPTDKDLWFLPLGGCGEIGMNLNLFGHNGSWLMVDCGITFEDSVTSRTGNRVEMPDPLFIANRHEALAGIIATHAHEDHIGALPHLWEQLRCPIYTTPFTRNVVARKFAQAGIRAPLVTVHPGETIEIGPFKVTWVPITHSTPETNGLLIDTPAGRVLHTADWKVDPAPVVGEPIQPKLFQSIGDRGVGRLSVIRRMHRSRVVRRRSLHFSMVCSRQCRRVLSALWSLASRATWRGSKPSATSLMWQDAILAC